MVSWRLIFLVNVPVALLIAALLTRAPTSPRRTAPFDWIGQISAVVAMSALTFAVIEGGTAGRSAAVVGGVAALAVAASAVLVTSQVRGRHPMVPRTLTATPGVRPVVLAGFTFMACYYGMPFVMGLYLQEERGLEPLQAGEVFLPMMLIGALIVPFSARLVARFGAARVVTGGLACMVAGLVPMAAVGPVVPVWALAALMMLFGIGGPTVMPPLAAVLLATVPPGLAGTASGLLNTSRQLGGALAVAAFGAFLAGPGSFTSGMRTSLLAAAALAAATTLVARRLPALPHRRGTTDALQPIRDAAPGGGPTGRLTGRPGANRPGALL
jgi:MFS family permease